MHKIRINVHPVKVSQTPAYDILTEYRAVFAMPGAKEKLFECPDMKRDKMTSPFDPKKSRQERHISWADIENPDIDTASLFNSLHEEASRGFDGNAVSDDVGPMSKIPGQTFAEPDPA
jgi:hypothetical protein